MSTRRRPSVEERRIQPWHIALLVVALLIVGWQVLGYVGEKRREGNVKYTKGEYQNVAPPGSILPGAGLQRIHEDKDSGR